MRFRNSIELHVFENLSTYSATKEREKTKDKIGHNSEERHKAESSSDPIKLDFFIWQ
jgi:hypothetical protein